MKSKLLITSLLIGCMNFISYSQTVINSISFPDNYKAGAEQLILNGGGTREKYWMDMYVAALYLPGKNNDAMGIITANNSMVIRICIVSGLISSDKMIKAVNEGFQKSVGEAAKKFEKEIGMFKQAFSESIKVGDVFDVVYLPEKILIYKNNSLKIEVNGYEFKKAVFGIWLGANPADENLKKGMLGN